MAAVFADPTDPEDAPGDTPDSRRAFALRHGIALWDVIAECDIDGASDASIANAVAERSGSADRGSCIALVATTGAKATQLYRRLCTPLLEQAGLSVPHVGLPSTSPANAAMSLDRLIAAYREVLTPTGR